MRSSLCLEFFCVLSSSSYFISMTAIVKFSRKNEQMMTHRMKYMITNQEV